MGKFLISYPWSIPQTTLPLIQSSASQTFRTVRNHSGDEYVRHELVNDSGGGEKTDIIRNGIT